MDQQVYEKLLPLQRNCRIDVLAELYKLLVSQALPVRRPVFQAFLNVKTSPLSLFAQTTDVRVLLDPKSLKELIERSLAISFELKEGVIDGSHPLLSEVVADPPHEHHIVDTVFMWELVADHPDLLRCEEDS